VLTDVFGFRKLFEVRSPFRQKRDFRLDGSNSWRGVPHVVMAFWEVEFLKRIGRLR